MSRLKLTPLEKRILNLYVDDPFITYVEISKMYKRYNGYANNVIKRICKRNNLKSRYIRLHLFTHIGWIKPTNDYSKIQCDISRNSPHRELLDWLATKPYMTTDELAKKIYYSEPYTHRLLSTLYQVNVGKNEVTSQKLRLFHKLGWYRPFLLTDSF